VESEIRRRFAQTTSGPSGTGLAARLRHLVLVACVLVSCHLVTAEAHAISPEEKAAAREAATAGIRAFQEAEYDTALELLRKAEQIMHAPPHLIYIARAHTAKREFVLAREALKTLVNEVLPPDAPAAFHDAQAAGRALEAEIEPKIGRLLIRVEGVTGPVSLRVDGKVVPDAILGAPYPVDPGIRTVVAECTGCTSSEEFVTVGEGQTQEVTLELSPPPPPPPPQQAAPPPQPAAAPPPPPEPVEEPRRTLSPWVLGGFGTAAVGIVVGSITGGISLAKTNDAKARYCFEGMCDSAAGPALDEANALANVSNVAFALAAVGVGVGVYGLLASPTKTTSRATAAPRGRFAVGPQGVRADLSWTF
jgi:hypothetical protein